MQTATRMALSRAHVPQTKVFQAIRFRHLNYNLDRTQKLISSSTSQHLTKCNISSKSMHGFFA